MRYEQPGTKESTCVDHIATLRITSEQTIEWHTSLYLTVIDFQMEISRQGKRRFSKFMPCLNSVEKQGTNQLRIFNINVKSVLPYESETWGGGHQHPCDKIKLAKQTCRVLTSDLKKIGKTWGKTKPSYKTEKDEKQQQLSCVPMVRSGS